MGLILNPRLAIIAIVAAAAIPALAKKCKPAAKAVADNLIKAGEQLKKAAEEEDRVPRAGVEPKSVAEQRVAAAAKAKAAPKAAASRPKAASKPKAAAKPKTAARKPAARKRPAAKKQAPKAP